MLAVFFSVCFSLSVHLTQKLQTADPQEKKERKSAASLPLNLSILHFFHLGFLFSIFLHLGFSFRHFWLFYESLLLMGRYIRKSKPVGEVVLMELAQSSSSLGGVRTRAKTLALQRLQKLSAVTGTADGSPVTGGSYLQLRNRRLAKPPIPGVVSKRQKLYLSNSSPSSNFRDSGSQSGYRRRIEETNSRSSVSVSMGGSEKKVEEIKEEKIEEKENGDFSIETSFGENMLEIDCKERSTRESTPISLIRDPQMVTTPGSTTRPERSSRSNSMRMDHSCPTTEELDLFFADSEQQQKKQFIDKYNFDPAKEEPLPGRFKWVKPNL